MLSQLTGRRNHQIVRRERPIWTQKTFRKISQNNPYNHFVNSTRKIPYLISVQLCWPLKIIQTYYFYDSHMNWQQMFISATLKKVVRPWLSILIRPFLETFQYLKSDIEKKNIFWHQVWQDFQSHNNIC